MLTIERSYHSPRSHVVISQKEQAQKTRTTDIMDWIRHGGRVTGDRAQKVPPLSSKPIIECFQRYQRFYLASHFVPRPAFYTDGAVNSRLRSPPAAFASCKYFRGR